MEFFSALPKTVSSVVDPDHPFTYNGPDFLLYNKHGLVAGFKIQKKERQNPRNLITRLISSLVVYPPYTKMLLLLDHSTKAVSFSKLENHYFDRIIEVNDLKRANSILRDKKSSNATQAIKALQKRLFNVQAQIQKNNIEYIQKKPRFDKIRSLNLSEQDKKASYYDSFTNKEVFAKSQIFTHNDIIIGNKMLRKSKSDLKELKTFFDFSINSEFAIDSSVPYLIQSNRKVLNLDNIPIARYDPFKPLRIASLMGWYVGNSNNLKELQQRIPKFYRNI